VLSISTNMIVMLFVQSITYNLIDPDDGACEALMTEEVCLCNKINDCCCRCGYCC
jgi:hypothetical protein